MASANLKAFVSEKEINEQRERRQEEWDKVRTADQPEECPEEEYDPRSLFEKLQSQKDKKQSDFEEQFKFKNMIRGVDDEESKFLNDVAERQMKIEAQRMSEEKQLISEYKESVVNRTVPIAGQSSKVPSQPPEKKLPTGSKRSSQAALLAGAVKRKRPSSTDEAKSPEGLPSANAQNPGSSKPTRSSTDNGSKDQDENSLNESSSSGDAGEGQGVQCIAVLPGIGSYSNSSEDSDSDSSDSEGVELIKTVFHKGGAKHKCDGK